MSRDLATIFAPLVQRHVATLAEPLPTRTPGMTWIWAADGIYKRGVNATLDLLIRVTHTKLIPGLATLQPHMRWSPGNQTCLPGTLLQTFLHDARRAGRPIGALSAPIERQGFVVWDGARPSLITPRQHATSVSVHYAFPADVPVMLDLHSHHVMQAHFSRTDGHDDRTTGLSVSAVIGNIFREPEVLVRLNVYGDHAIVPALMVFDCLGPFTDAAAKQQVEEESDHANVDA